MNIEKAIKNGFKILKAKKIKTALLDSEILMSKILKKDRRFLIMNPQEEITNNDYKNFRKIIASRLKRKRVAYLTGVKSFWKYDFNVNEKVLIPRPETELLIEQILENYKNNQNINFLEIGTGSGCIILSILKEKKSFLGTGVDVSKDSLDMYRHRRMSFLL